MGKWRAISSVLSVLKLSTTRISLAHAATVSRHNAMFASSLNVITKTDIGTEPDESSLHPEATVGSMRISASGFRPASFASISKCAALLRTIAKSRSGRSLFLPIENENLSWIALDHNGQVLGASARRDEVDIIFDLDLIHH